MLDDYSHDKDAMAEPLTASDLESIVAHPLVPRGLTPELCGHLLALRELKGAAEIARMDHPLFGPDHEDYIVSILPSIRECRQRISEDFQKIGIDDDIDELDLFELANLVMKVRNDLKKIATLRAETYPSVTISHAYELPIDPEMQQRCIMLLEEILVFHREILWLMDLEHLAQDPKGPIMAADRHFIAGKFIGSQPLFLMPHEDRLCAMAEILKCELFLSDSDARLEVEEMIEDAYSDRYPLDQPSALRTRQLWAFLYKEQQQLQREKKMWASFG
jgi:hypothetical protein